MLALVTGAAGFIGSNLSDRLLELGWMVRGVDCFTPYYPEAAKRRNIDAALQHRSFSLVEEDLLEADLDTVLDGVDVVFHQAAQPGVRASWESGFRDYTELNLNATQRLLEAVRHSAVRRFVYASSSSVYGKAPQWPTAETDPTVPHSPYGVTKLAGELLCRAYAANFDVPTVALRYFTVYGPRQRPDMATRRLIDAAFDGTDFPLYGDGTQIRDFTFVGDVVEANIAAGTADVAPGTFANVAGGSSVTMLELIDMVADAVGSRPNIQWGPTQAGDVFRTGGAVERAATLFGWAPRVSLAEGIRRQVEWSRTERTQS